MKLFKRIFGFIFKLKIFCIISTADCSDSILTVRLQLVDKLISRMHSVGASATTAMGVLRDLDLPSTSLSLSLSLSPSLSHTHTLAETLMSELFLKINSKAFDF